MKWSRPCPICKKEQFYTTKGNRNQAERHKKPCKSCGQKLRPYEYLLNTIKYKANKRGIECTLTYEDLFQFTSIKSCNYCGDPIKWLQHNYNKRITSYNYYLDRINSNEGYSAINCCVCCPMCNGVKSNVFSHSEMMLLGKIIRQIKDLRNE